MSTIEFWSRYNPPPSPSVTFEDVSLTRQEFVRDADINNIMQRYACGDFPLPAGVREPMFGDWSDVPDYQTALQTVIDARDRFEQLPSDVRRRFDNDPGKLLDFLADPKNEDEARKMGFLEPKIAVKSETAASAAEPPLESVAQAAEPPPDSAAQAAE